MADSKQELLSEFLKLESCFPTYRRYHLTIASGDLNQDKSILRTICQKWRLNCDIQYLATVAHDADGDTHLHVAILSEREFERQFYPAFKEQIYCLVGEKSVSVNGRCVVCLKRHYNADKLYGYFLSDSNFSLSELRISRRHFYSTSRGFRTEQLQAAYRKFCLTLESVKRVQGLLYMAMMKLQETKEKADALEAFMKFIFPHLRDDGDTPVRSDRKTSLDAASDTAPLDITKSNNLKNGAYQTKRAEIIPSAHRRRAHYLFQKYEYLPEEPHILAAIAAKLPGYTPAFQARVIVRLLYDNYVHLWTHNRSLSIPPPPLDDFYSADLECLGSRDLSALLPPNPLYNPAHCGMRTILCFTEAGD